MRRREYQGRDYRRALNISELRNVARRRLPNFAFEYVDGGAEDEVTLSRNRSDFSNIAFCPKVLVGVAECRQHRTLFGRRIERPFLIGPTGFSGLISRDGDVALARAAADAGIPFVLSNSSTTPVEEVVEKGGGWVWMQLYMFKARAVAERLINRLKPTGVDVLVVTVDAMVFGNREWDRRSYAAPLELNLRNKLDVLAHPRWLLNVMIPNGLPRFKNLDGLLPAGKDNVRGAASAIGEELDRSLNWNDIRWLRDLWPGKLLVKGILSRCDAKAALVTGVDGIIVSNHGGRQLDGAMSAIEALDGIVAEVGGRMTILIDGGFRRGSDVVKAIALGADAVCLGRAPTYGLAAGGEQGACQALDILRLEVDRVLGQLGCPDINSIGSDFLHKPSSVSRIG